MIYEVFTVFDSKAVAYLQPFFSPTKGEAIRLFQECCNDPKHNFHKYASDFHLFQLGKFDNVKAEFIMLSAPCSIGNALEFIKPKE